MNDPGETVIRLYASADHACGYLPDQTARSAFIDPYQTLNPLRYQRLLEMGFRRSGAHVYRPLCDACRRCVPVRICAASFSPSRSQRRCARRNADLTLTLEDRLTDEHFMLYQRYLQTRHANGGMDPHDRVGFHQFLECHWLGVRYWCLRHNQRLLAVAVVDHLPQALSAVYTFFDPDESARGLGTYAVLQQIEAARAQQLPHVYLGYWIAESSKMAYKAHFAALQRCNEQGWQWLETAQQQAIVDPSLQ
ncbi:arginyltransferase [Sinimarinibacterium sp. NLF-5-8]|uniref:arginyltransferase n=1 Tax=Sinimarinibacterium sp. NLF-5-8 TaxID=2698684 RepID=UPI00137BEBB5|nr:arginyltransferase [Sinimarinibacterium sp. NLF-5-8]QHS09448.1 arginyltransferase [Sinimarinibacterium sp. NLF-5-8]